METAVKILSLSSFDELLKLSTEELRSYLIEMGHTPLFKLSKRELIDKIVMYAYSYAKPEETYELNPPLYIDEINLLTRYSNENTILQQRATVDKLNNGDYDDILIQLTLEQLQSLIDYFDGPKIGFNLKTTYENKQLMLIKEIKKLIDDGKTRNLKKYQVLDIDGLDENFDYSVKQPVINNFQRGFKYEISYRANKPISDVDRHIRYHTGQMEDGGEEGDESEYSKDIDEYMSDDYKMKN